MAREERFYGFMDLAKNAYGKDELQSVNQQGDDLEMAALLVSDEMKELVAQGRVGVFLTKPHMADLATRHGFANWFRKVIAPLDSLGLEIRWGKAFVVTEEILEKWVADKKPLLKSHLELEGKPTLALVVQSTQVVDRKEQKGVFNMRREISSEPMITDNFIVSISNGGSDGNRLVETQLEFLSYVMKVQAGE